MSQEQYDLQPVAAEIALVQEIAHPLNKKQSAEEIASRWIEMARRVEIARAVEIKCASF